MKCQYKSPYNVLFNYCWGEDFELLPGGQGTGPKEETRQVAAGLSTENLQKLVAEGVKEALSQGLQANTSRSKTPEREEPSQDVIFITFYILEHWKCLL